MNRQTEQLQTRRKFLRMLSASPLLASPGLLAGSFASLLAAGEVTEKKFLGWLDSLSQSDEVISSPDQALEVMDFEAAARLDRKSTRLNSSHITRSRMPSSA